MCIRDSSLDNKRQSTDQILDPIESLRTYSSTYTATDWRQSHINSKTCWLPSIPNKNSLDNWVTMDLKENKIVAGVAVKGRHASYSQWVTKFKVSYSINGSNYTLVDNGKIFTGNNDRNTINNVLFNS